MYKLKVMRPLNQLSVRRFVSPVRFSASLCLAAALLLLASSSGESSAQGIANNFTPTGVSGGGRLLSASLNPLNPSQALLVCDMMGLYRTEDEGLRWQMNAANGFVASNPSTTSDQLLKFTGDALPALLAMIHIGISSCRRPIRIGPRQRTLRFPTLAMSRTFCQGIAGSSSLPGM